MFSFEKRYFFIAGLPRSGSTLLSTILSQNPEIYSSITSPVLPLFRSAYDVLGIKREYETLVPDNTKERVLCGIFDNYYSFTSKSVIFDTNRVWPNTFYAVKKLFPYTKIILMVRDIPWVIDSFERLRNSNPLSLSEVFTKEDDYSVYTRASSLMKDNGIVHNAYFATRSLWYSEFADDIILITYDELAKDPAATIRKIYRSINVQEYSHDFTNTGSSYDQYDKHLGLVGLHNTRSEVKYIHRKSILPPEIWNQYSGMEFWK